MSTAVDRVFGALADPTRRALLQRLLDEGPHTATRLAERAPVTRQAIVKHLQVLAGAGLAVPEREGREVRWSARPDALDEGVRWMVQAGASWDRRLERLRRGVDAAAGSRRRPPR